MDYDELRRKAKSIVVIPEDYRLEMEDNTPKEREIARSFIWEDPEKTDYKIEVGLDLETGHLLRLEIDRGSQDAAGYDRPAGEARAAADAFLMKHTPGYAAFTWVTIEEKGNVYFIAYREEVGGLPLPNTGCEITLDKGLNVSRYQLARSGQKDAPKPEWPGLLADGETVRRQVLSDLRMNLTLVTLHPSLYEIEGTEPEWRLVYEPVPAHRMIDAITGVDLFGLEHYRLPASRPIAQPGADKSNEPLQLEGAKDSAAWEMQLGIDPSLYVQKSKDDGERIIRLYMPREEAEEDPAEEELSVDAYMKRKWGPFLPNLAASFMVQIEKSTGRLLGFLGNKREEEAVPSLSRKQCWEKAEQFLQGVFPEYASYLQMEVDGEDGDREPQEREFFYLPVYVSNTPVNFEQVILSVSTLTGKILSYMGVSYEMIRRLTESNFYPALTPEQALDRYCKHVRFRLRWFNKNPEGKLPVYRLIYEPATTRREDFPLWAGTNRELRYIDACSGEPIWERIDVRRRRAE